MNDEIIAKMEKENKLCSKLEYYGYFVHYDSRSNKTLVHKKGTVYGYLDNNSKIIRNELKGKLQYEKGIIRKAKIVGTKNKEYPYNVQILNSVDYGKTFFYSGKGRFCKTKEEAQNYKLKFDKIEGVRRMKNNFIEDENKIISMLELSKQGFLMSYEDVTELEYENTKEWILQFVRSKKKLNEKLNEKKIRKLE